ncbi:LuxR C-terminal-related transcriptional regulator [Pseudomonas sp. 22526]|uniref:LuxR C-terminal-related transcriptional regulator n=1 Tax=Pseudomonas sp. 22526 TaxID=3453937 RepID=UPI003F8457E9
MLNAIRVGVLDEQEVVRYGLCRHLASQSGMVVTGSYRSSNHALRAAHQGEIDLLLMDHTLEQSDGIGLIKTLKKELPQLKLLALMPAPNTVVATLLFTLGVRGVVCKTQPLKAYVEAVRALAAGGLYCCSGLAENQPQAQSTTTIAAESSDVEAALLTNAVLSSRERDVLRLCISGLTVTQIAYRFGRSVKTISAQKLAAYRKLGLKNDMDLFKNLSRHRT